MLTPDQQVALLTAALRMQQQQQQLAAASGQNLAPVLDAERVLPLVEDERTMQDLLPLLPDGQRTPEHLRATIRSPQFQQTLARLSAALNGPSFGQVMASFGLPIGAEMGVQAFLAALMEQAEKQKAKDGKGESDGK
jgi:hypothetical protein